METSDTTLGHERDTKGEEEDIHDAAKIGKGISRVVGHCCDAEERRNSKTVMRNRITVKRATLERRIKAMMTRRHENDG